jgi:tight adherence protein C
MTTLALTILIFTTLTFSIFFEILYAFSKRSYLQKISLKNSPHKINPLKRLAKKLNWQQGIVLPKIFNYSNIETLLHKSGQPFELTIKHFITLHRLLGDLAFLFLLLSTIFSENILPSILINLFLWLAIVYLPILWLKALIARRNKEFNYHLSTFIDMLSLSVNAGMNFENALFATTDKFKGAIHEEFKQVQHEIAYGKSLEKSLDSLSKKIESIDLKRFVTAVKQSKKLGTPMSQTLAIQSKLILTSRIQKAEELSRTASVKISIPLVFFIFPALLILYLVPALLQFMK